jgi:hypothetical protein
MNSEIRPTPTLEGGGNAAFGAKNRTSNTKSGKKLDTPSGR